MNNGTALALQPPPPTTGPALATLSPSSALAFEPADVQSAVNLAKLLVASRLLPRTLATPEAAFTVIMVGRELGLTAMQSIRSIHVIEGKPTMSADLMVALVKRSPVCRYFRIVESTADVATYETLRDGEEKPTRLSWTAKQAREAGLAGKGNWKNFPDAMLRARAAAALCRAVYPDVMLGVYETDEIAPSAPIAEVVPSTANADVIEAFIQRIEAAATLPELEAIAPEIKGSGLSPKDVAVLKAEYAAARERLTAAPPAADPAPPTTGAA